MRNVILGIGMSVVVLATVGTANGQSWTLPCKRLSSSDATITVTPPTVINPYTKLDLDEGHGSDAEPSNSGDTLAHATSSTSYQVETGIGTIQTVGDASCGNATNTTDYAPQVDTLLTAYLSVYSEQNTVDTDGEWKNAAVVVTQYEVQNRPGYNTVSHGNLAGSVSLWAQLSGTEGMTGATSPLHSAVLETRAGSSHLKASFLGIGGGWYLEGEITQTSSSDPNAESQSYSDLTYSDDVDEMHFCYEYVAVPSKLALYGLVWNGGLDPEDPESFEGDIRADGTTYQNCNCNINLKASADFSVTSVPE